MLLTAFAWLAVALLLWAPFWWCCCDCNGSIKVTVIKCASAAASGATVTLKKAGVTVTSGTTNGSGQITFTGLDGPASDYSVVITGVANYATYTSTSISVTCGTLTSVSYTLSPAAGYSCTRDPCNDPASPGPPYQQIQPSVIYVDDGFGAITCSLVTDGWYGTSTRSASSAAPQPWAATAPGCVLPALPAATVPVWCWVRCSGGNWIVVMGAYIPYDSSDPACSASVGFGHTSPGCFASFAPAAVPSVSSSTTCGDPYTQYPAGSYNSDWWWGGNATPTSYSPVAGTITVFPVKAICSTIYGASTPTFTFSE